MHAPSPAPRLLRGSSLPRALWVSCLLWATASLGCGGRATPLRVLAASSLTEVVPELTAAFGSAGAVQHSFAGTNRLARQIEQGAPADVFLSANTRWDGYLYDRGLTENGHDHVFAENRLVVIVPKDAPVGMPLRELFGRSRRIGLAGESVPAGQYADLALRDAGLLDEVRPKIVRADSVSLVLHWVASNEMGAGIVYQTDAQRRSEDVTIAHTFDVEAHGPIEYTAAAVTDARHGDEARAFLSFLRSDDAREVLLRHGFSPR